MPSWANVNAAVPSFQDVMSEQLADKLHSDNLKRIDEDRNVHGVLDEELAVKLALAESMADMTDQGTGNVSPEGASDVVFPATIHTHEYDTDCDFILAKTLQNEWNKEHNTFLQREEHHISGNSKVSVSLKMFRNDDASDESDEECDGLDEGCFDGLLSKSDFNIKASPKQHYRGGKDEPTKHDLDICGKRNTSKLIDFPPEFPSGDSYDLSNVQLTNVVYNKLMCHSKSEMKRANRLHEKKEHSTADHAMDPRTRLVLYKMLNNGLFERINGIMAVGKESVVIHAEGGMHGEVQLPPECAVKIYKTTLTGFKNREMYVRGDHRFSRDDYKKQNPRRIIKLWAYKEKSNLDRMKKYGLPCPQVVALKKHVLVMSLIGSNGRPAPQLKTVAFSTVDAQIAYDQTVEIMRKLERDCRLVHADLSEYNLLWHDGRVHVIDVSQTVELTHPLAMQFLYRDCRNVSDFFKSLAVHDVLSTEDLFRDVTGLDISGEGDIFLSNVRRYDKEKPTFIDLPDQNENSYQFDHFFELTSAERVSAQ